MFTEFWLGNFTGRGCFQDLCIDRWMLLKRMSKKKGGRMSADFSGSK